MKGEYMSWQWCMWLSCGCYALWYLLASFIGEVKPAGSLFPVFLCGYTVAGLVGFFGVLQYQVNRSAEAYQFGLTVLCGLIAGAGALLYFMAVNRAGADSDKQGQIAAVSSLSPAPAAIILLVIAAVTTWSEMKGTGERLLGTVLVLAGVYLLARHS
jgi:uncharacterized membrane protein